MSAADIWAEPAGDFRFVGHDAAQRACFATLGLHEHDEIAVRAELGVAGDQSQWFAERLRNQHSIKRITVMVGKRSNRQGVSPRHCELAYPCSRHSRCQSAEVGIQPAESGLDRHFP